MPLPWCKQHQQPIFTSHITQVTGLLLLIPKCYGHNWIKLSLRPHTTRIRNLIPIQQVVVAGSCRHTLPQVSGHPPLCSYTGGWARHCCSSAWWLFDIRSQSQGKLSGCMGAFRHAIIISSLSQCQKILPFLHLISQQHAAINVEKIKLSDHPILSSTVPTGFKRNDRH